MGVRSSCAATLINSSCILSCALFPVKSLWDHWWQILIQKTRPFCPLFICTGFLLHLWTIRIIILISIVGFFSSIITMQVHNFFKIYPSQLYLVRRISVLSVYVKFEFWFSFHRHFLLLTQSPWLWMQRNRTLVLRLYLINCFSILFRYILAVFQWINWWKKAQQWRILQHRYRIQIKWLLFFIILISRRITPFSSPWFFFDLPE